MSDQLWLNIVQIKQNIESISMLVKSHWTEPISKKISISSDNFNCKE